MVQITGKNQLTEIKVTTKRLDELKMNVIGGIPLFSNLPVDEVEYLESIVSKRLIPAGTLLIREGDPNETFSIILEGEVEIVKSLDTPDQRTLAHESKGAFLGEMSLLYSDQRRTASVITRTDVALAEMSSDEFNNLIQRVPNLAIHILREMITRFHNSDQATIRVLKEKNQRLTTAYEQLKEAQAQLIEKEKMEHEMRMGRKIQENSLPKQLPDLPGWNIFAFWKPARQVSGDFYDFIHLDRNHLGIVVGDVAGKGVPAALVMATTRSVLRATATEYGSPSDVLKRTNDLLREEMPPNMFVTCLYAVLDTATGELCLANAGHNLPQVCLGDLIQEVRATGMPLGLMENMEYEERACRMGVGDRMLLYSDGLVEAHNPQGEIYGFKRLKDRLLELSQSYEIGDAEAIVQNLLLDLETFTGSSGEQEDDITFLILERVG